MIRPGGPDKRGRGQRRGGRGHGRRDYSHLPGREEVHDVPEAERVCPRCGTGYVRFGEESCEQIDWQVQLTRIVHRRPTYRRSCGCPVRGVLVAPPVPKAIGKGRFTTGFLARLLVEKFVLGRPAHRIVAALAHDGFDLAEGTLAGMFAACSDLLAPLAQLITDRNAAAAHLHIDETSWNVYAAVQGKDSHRWWCWVFVGPDTTVFTIAPSRSTKILTEHLGIDTDDDDKLPDALPGGRELLLSSDFYVVYQVLGRVDGVDNLWCWSQYAESGIMRNGAVRVAGVACRGGDRSDAWSGRFCIITGFRGRRARGREGDTVPAWCPAGPSGRVLVLSVQGRRGGRPGLSAGPRAPAIAR